MRVVGAVVALATGCQAGTPEATAPPTPVATPAASPDVDGQRQRDLDELVDAYAAHPQPPQLDDALDELRSRLGVLSDDEYLVELMRLTAGRDRDGHTGVFPLAQSGLDLWPLRLYAFEEGWRVLDATPEHQGLVGGRITRIGGHPVEEVEALVSPLVSRDNAASLRARVAQYLVVPAVLRGVGVEPVLEVDGRTVDVPAIPSHDYAAWTGLTYPLICPALHDPEAPVWGIEEHPDAVVARYRRVLATSDGQHIRAYADELDEAVTRVDPSVVVVDLRGNPGGDTGTYRSLLQVVQRIAEERPGALRLLIDRCTFSAATNFVVEVLASTDAVTVGETMGGAPAMWGDAREHGLPSGIVVHVATRAWQLGDRGLPDALAPDVAVATRWSDVEDGVDAPLDTALSAG